RRPRRRAGGRSAPYAQEPARGRRRAGSACADRRRADPCAARAGAAAEAGGVIDAIEILRHQSARGPLPASRDHLPAWVARQTAAITVEVAFQAVSPLRAAGIVVEERDGKALAHVPADGDALDRIFSLLALPPIEGGGAALLLAALERSTDLAEEPP